MLKQRVAVGLLGAPLALAAAWFGGWPWFMLVVLCLTLGTRELFSIVGDRSDSGLIGHVAVVATMAGVVAVGELAIVIAAVWVPIALLVQQVLKRHAAGLGGVVWALFGWAYLGALGSHFLLLRGLLDGRFWLSFALLTTWAFDTTAFFVGRRWGRTRLVPRISPGKSVEGFVAGTIAAVLVAAAMAVLLGQHLVLGGLSVGRACLLGLVVAVAGQAGDLAESVIKRSFGAKDSGRLLPGHGGILDRIDSLLFVVPIIYHLVAR